MQMPAAAAPILYSNYATEYGSMGS